MDAWCDDRLWGARARALPVWLVGGTTPTLVPLLVEVWDDDMFMGAGGTRGFPPPVWLVLLFLVILIMLLLLLRQPPGVLSGEY